MTRVCFHHDHFDVDVSSGTSHALYQWFELLHAFNVFECAIINTSGDELPTINSEMKVNEYSRLEDFLATAENVTFVEMGGQSFKTYDYSNVDWIVFGGTGGLRESHIGIDTFGGRALYPREAAAIILAAI
jgi:hypothetical protein